MKDKHEAIKLLTDQFPQGRLIRKIVRIEVIEEIVYPELIGKWKNG